MARGRDSRGAAVGRRRKERRRREGEGRRATRRQNRAPLGIVDAYDRHIINSRDFIQHGCLVCLLAPKYFSLHIIKMPQIKEGCNIRMEIQYKLLELQILGIVALKNISNTCG